MCKQYKLPYRLVREYLCVYYPFHIIGQGCCYRQSFVRDRVGERHLCAVQGLSVYQLTFFAVHIVTDERVTDMCHMTAYLVRSARFENKSAKAVSAVSFGNKEIRCGVLSVITHTALYYRLFFPCDRRADTTAAYLHILANADIHLFAAFLQSVRAKSAFSHYHTPAGVAVKAVDASKDRIRAVRGKKV